MDRMFGTYLYTLKRGGRLEQYKMPVEILDGTDVSYKIKYLQYTADNKHKPGYTTWVGKVKVTIKREVLS